MTFGLDSSVNPKTSPKFINLRLLWNYFLQAVLFFKKASLVLTQVSIVQYVSAVCFNKHKQKINGLEQGGGAAGIQSLFYSVH